MTASGSTPPGETEFKALIALAEREHAAGRLIEAAAAYRKILAIVPHAAEVHNNLGAIGWQQGDVDQAAAHFEKVVALRPQSAEAHCRLATVLRTQGRLDAAIVHFRQALAAEPNHGEAQTLLGTCYLAQGRFELGWRAYEARRRLPGADPPPSLPRYQGQPLTGQTLLLLAEQGLGDTLQFIRYARLLKARGGRIVLVCQPKLAPLLASQPHVDSFFDELAVMGSGQPLPRADFYLPLLSAPLVLGTNGSTIPRDVPYISADPKLVEHWHRQLAEIDGLRIGVAWQGRRNHVADRWRSMPLAQFAPLAALPGVRLISLQKGFGAEQIATVDFPVVDLGGRLDEAAGPLMDTAAAVQNLDLVVTIDSVIGHLAGAMGVPVWLALHLGADWRWQLGRDESPWYPTMRLFRQRALGRWSDVFERIAAAILALRSESA